MYHRAQESSCHLIYICVIHMCHVTSQIQIEKINQLAQWGIEALKMTHVLVNSISFMNYLGEKGLVFKNNHPIGLYTHKQLSVGHKYVILSSSLLQSTVKGHINLRQICSLYMQSLYISIIYMGHGHIAGVNYLTKQWARCMNRAFVFTHFSLAFIY